MPSTEVKVTSVEPLTYHRFADICNKPILQQHFHFASRGNAGRLESGTLVMKMLLNPFGTKTCIVLNRI